MNRDVTTTYKIKCSLSYWSFETKSGASWLLLRSISSFLFILHDVGRKVNIYDIPSKTSQRKHERCGIILRTAMSISCESKIMLGLHVLLLVGGVISIVYKCGVSRRPSPFFDISRGVRRLRLLQFLWVSRATLTFISFSFTKRCVGRGEILFSASRHFANFDSRRVRKIKISHVPFDQLQFAFIFYILS